ncbi:pericentrin [Pelodytes ibericus]
MEETAEEQRRKKLQAGKAKLAHFRQRKTKGEGPQAKKKTKKRKGALVHTNDVPSEEGSLEAQENTTEEYESELTMHTETHLECRSLGVPELENMSDLGVKLITEQDKVGQHSVNISDFQKNMDHDLASDILQQELQVALHERDDIISRLSSKLQQALQSREEMEEEAILASNEIHSMQLQLQDASDILKSKSAGKTELYQAQQQISVIQLNLNQTTHMSRLNKSAQDLEKELETSRKTTKDKGNQITKLEAIMLGQDKKLEASKNYSSSLQKKLSDQQTLSVYIQTEPLSEHVEGLQDSRGSDHVELCHNLMERVQSLTAVIEDLKQKLMESETLRENLHLKLEEQMLQFEKERSCLEQKHSDTLKSLTLQLERAEEQTKEIAAQDKQEKERLNEELCHLKDRLKLETENSQNLRLQHSKELQAYMDKLQNLGDEKERMFQELSNTRAEHNLSFNQEGQTKLLQSDLNVESFRHELADLKKSLNRVKAQKEHENCKVAQLQEDVEHNEQNYLCEITSMDKYLVPSYKQEILEESVNLQDSSRIELDSDFILEQSLDSTVEGNINLLCSPMPITSVLAGGVSVGTLLDPESFAVYLSSNLVSPELQSHLSNLSDDRLIQRCALLMEQLEDKEQQLQKCSSALEEALGKWREVTSELSAAQVELEREKATNKGDYKEKPQMQPGLQIERDVLRIHTENKIVKEEQKLCIEELCIERDLLKSTISAKEESLVQLVEQNQGLQQSLKKAIELNEKLECHNLQLNDNLQDSEKGRESDRQEFDNKLNSKGMEQQLLHEAIEEKEAEFSEREKDLVEQLNALREVKAELESRLQKEVDRMNKECLMNMEDSEQNWKAQVALLKQEHERELHLLYANHREELRRVCSDLQADQQQRLEELQQQLESAHHIQMEQRLQQAQAAHHLEFEALRLSLTNMHTAHLELSQSNLHKEKENALVQLREKLNDKRAQEVAILQGRHQYNTDTLQNQHSQEMERVLDQHFQKIEQMQEDYSREKLQLQEDHSQEIFQLQEQHGREMDGLREQHSQEKEWMQQEQQQYIAQMKETVTKEMSAQHEDSLKNLQVQLEDERKRSLELTGLESVLRSEIDQLKEKIQSLPVSSAREQDAQESVDSNLDSETGKAHKLQSNVQQGECYYVQDEQLQMNNLQFEYHEQTVTPSQEIQLFLSQLDISRASREELHDLKQQLLARSAQVEEIKRLKQEFEAQRLLLKTEHEGEMDELRIYFEEKSRATEENYREELEILHQRLREMSDEDRAELMALNSSPFSIDLVSESEQMQNDLLQQLTDQLERHKEELSFLRLQSEKHKEEMDALHTALDLQYKEDILKMKLDLSDQYVTEIESLKKKHSLDLEHLRARLSEEHIREIKLHLQNTQEDLMKTDVGERIPGFKEGDQDFPHDMKTDNPPDLTMNDQDVLRRHREPMSGKMYKRDQSCQTELHHNLQISESSSTLCVTSVGERGFEELSNNQLQDQSDNELEVCTDKMVELLEEVKQQLQAESDSALGDSQNRFELQDHENSEKPTSPLRKQPEENLPEENYGDVRNPALDLQEEELSIHLLELQSKHKAELSARLSDLQVHHKEELGARLSELQRQHEEELGARVSELQRQHEEELGARVSELQRQHEEELELRTVISEHEAQIQSMEISHLSKLDTLESSYLTEIQKIRDEHAHSLAELEACLSECLQEKEREMQDKFMWAEAQWLEQHENKLQLAQDLLRKDLATVHMEKFQAMSKELEAAHMEDLNEKLEQQRCQLEEDKNQALDALREHVLQMERNNLLALQELQDLHRTEVQNSLEHSQDVKDELSKLKEQLEKQELVITELSCQRQTLSAELKDKCDQQLHLQEEIELLKCQSEMLLEQQVTQLKEEYDASKNSALQEKEEQLRGEAEKVQTALRVEMDQLVEQLQEKGQLILELKEKVSVLTKEMETSESQLEVLVQRRERENQEADNLVAMLQSDAHSSQKELKQLQDSCQRLLRLFTEVLKGTLSTEDLIRKNVGLCLDKTWSPNDVEDCMETLTKPMAASVHLKGDELLEKKWKHRGSPECDTMTEYSLMSSDEGCELSEYLCDSVLGGLEVGLENEEKILQISQRLRTAVERLLEMVTNSSVQTEQTREMQKHLQEEFSSRNQEMAQAVNQNQDLLKRLLQETENKNQLQVELHKAQGLIEGYAAENKFLEETLSGKESAEHDLVIELENSREQLHILTNELAVYGDQREVLLQEIQSGNVKDVEVELLKETERLATEKQELHCQAKKDRSNLLSQMKVLEMELDEQMSRNQELMRKTSEMPELKQQILSLEKQLKNQRQFMDEQAVEREHERDEFQQEIQKLEEKLKQDLRSQGDFRTHELYDWSIQIETLEARVKEKSDDCNVLLERKDNLEQQIVERNEEIDKMLVRIQELEQAALSNAEAARNCRHLEAELQKIRKIEKELSQDKEALQQQQYNNVLQISALQSKLDESRHRVPVEGDADSILKEELQAEREALHRKEKAESLPKQLEQFKEDLVNKTEEVLQLSMQLEIQRKQGDLIMNQAQAEWASLKDEISTLQQQREQQRSNSSMQFPQALLQEKNQEIDHLNNQLLRLEQEQNATNSQCAEVEELSSLVEHLRSDQERFRKDKEEEVERLHEVIEKLQGELEQLGPNRHEVSDSQESLDQLGLGEVENLQNELRKGVKQPYGFSENDLDHPRKCSKDLQQEFITSLNDPELETLRQQLDEKEVLYSAEIKALEENLHNLQDLHRQQTQEMTSLQKKCKALQEESLHLRMLLAERDREVATISSQVQEKELLVQTLQGEKAADKLDMTNQLAQKGINLEEVEAELKELQKSKASLQERLDKHSMEQRKLEKQYKDEIQNQKEHISEYEVKVKSLMEQMQILQAKSLMESEMATMKERLSAAENVSNMRESELRSTEGLLANVKSELANAYAECERKEERYQQVLQQFKRQNVCMAELQSYSQNLGAQVQRVQDSLLHREATIPTMSRQLQNQEDRRNNPYDLSAYVKPGSFTDSLTDLSAWDSPDMVRKQEDQVHSLRVFTPFSDISIECSNEHHVIPSKSSVQLTQPGQFDHLGSGPPSFTGSSYSRAVSNDTERSSPVGDMDYTITDSAEDQRSESDHKGDYAQSDRIYANHFNPESERAGFLLRKEGDENSMGGKGLSQHLQTVLRMVHEESCRILALSERPVVQMPCEECHEHALHKEIWQEEKLNLQEAIQTLSSALTKAIGKDEKDSSDNSSDWRRELLQSVQVLLERERDYLCLEMKSHLSQGDFGDHGSVSEKMELMMKEQEEQKRLVLEHLLASDRRSLLSEIQDLRSQLRMSHLQNQERLQQLQETLTNTEEKGSMKEHQLRRQVELLEYKLQQEASISADLKASLSHERERASEQHRLLQLEQGSVSQLRTEQEEILLEQEKILKSQRNLQKEISQLRDELESKDQAISVHMQTLKTMELGNIKAEEEKSLAQQKVQHKEKYIQELSISLEEQRVMNNKLSADLNQEQSCSENLRKELKIELSRFEALLSQENSKMSQVEKELEKMRQHSQSLSYTLTVEHNMLEQLKHQHSRELSRNEQEKLHAHNLVLELRSQLKGERNQAKEQASMMEKTHHQAISAKRQLESELQASREESQQEREASIKLRAMLESLQSQKHQMDSTLEAQRERESRLQKERDQYQAQLLTLQEEQRSWGKEREMERKRDQEAKANKMREEECKRHIQDLQLQHERDLRRIQELQHMLADLEEQERTLNSRRGRLVANYSSSSRNVTSFDSSSGHTQKLEKVLQQLLHIVLQVRKWVQNRNSLLLDFPTEEEVTSLVEILTELRFELQQPHAQPSTRLSSTLMDVLRSENEELAKSVSLVTKEKLELENQLDKLRNSRQQTPQRGVQEEQLRDAKSSILETERAVWQREKHLLQIALKHAESKPVPDVSHLKIQRLYRRYMRAESFRKALVYQKKYLLLLLGGFQACEKAVLCQISRMGLYPSSADVPIATSSRPGLTRFRSAVRVVIAISRLKFLVRKWNKINRKCGVGETVIQNSTSLQQGMLSRTAVLQHLGSTLLNSPPTRDVPLCLRHSPVAIDILSNWTQNRLVKGMGHSPSSIIPPAQLPSSTQDPERSITEYIKHLEMVQQRLGGQ